MLAAVATAALVVAIESAAAGNGGKCLIVNLSGVDGNWSALQAAQDAANPGDTLKVKGTCVGTTTISKNLTIVGAEQPRFRRRDTRRQSGRQRRHRQQQRHRHHQQPHDHGR